MTGFYMKCNAGLIRVNVKPIYDEKRGNNEAMKDAFIASNS